MVSVLNAYDLPPRLMTQLPWKSVLFGLSIHGIVRTLQGPKHAHWLMGSGRLGIPCMLPEHAWDQQVPAYIAQAHSGTPLRKLSTSQVQLGVVAPC